MEKQDVFISYHTQSSKNTVLRIAETLENAGISCWYAPRNVMGDYASSIVRGIRNCKVFLLILNEFAERSEDVRNEINCAFERQRQHEDIALLPFKVDACGLSDANFYYLGRIHIMDGGIPPEPLRIRELVDRIRYILDKGPGVTLVVQKTDDPLPEKHYRLAGQMVYPDPHFIGRQDVLREIADKLSAVANKVFLVGMGGIGKSEIAKMFIKNSGSDYEVVRWVSFESSLQRTIASDSLFPIQGLQKMDYPEDDERAYFERKLQLLKQIADQRVLIAVDNFDVTDDPDLENFCSSNYGVIFTTRYHQNGINLPEITVDGMTDEADLMALFRAEYQRSLTAEDLETVHRILSLLEGNPLAIRLVASAMQKNRRMRPDTMLEMLKSGTVHGEKQGVKGTGTIGSYLQQVFHVSSLTEEEQHLLKNLTLIPLQGIAVEQFYDWCELDNFDVVDALIESNWVIHDPVTDKIHLHPLVADLMLEELKKDPTCCNKLIDSIHATCIVEKDSTWEEKLWLNDLASSLYTRLPLDHEKRPLALESKARLSVSMAHYEDAAQQYCQLLPFIQTRERRLEIHYKHAHAWVLGGFGQEGISAAQAGIAEATDIPFDELTRLEGNWLAALYNRMTEAYVHLAQYDQAVVYARMAVEVGEKGFYSKTYESSQGWREFHLARALLYAGQYAEAEKVIRSAISKFEMISDMWSANYAYDILGQILAKTERCEEALQLNSRAAEILLPFYRNAHADSAANLEYRGNIFAAMGETEKARLYYQQAIDIYAKCKCYKRAENVRNKMME